MFCLNLCVCTMCKPHTLEARRKEQVPGTGVTDGCRPSYGSGN